MHTGTTDVTKQPPTLLYDTFSTFRYPDLVSFSFCIMPQLQQCYEFFCMLIVAAVVVGILSVTQSLDR